MFTTAHFHVIHAARAFTSSSVTCMSNRMPPFAGPREVGEQLGQAARERLAAADTLPAGCAAGGKAMKVSDIMTRDVHLLSPDQTIREAASIMADIDAGALPVGENDRLVGMITDRDIVIRAVALGKSIDTKVADVMSKEMLYCFDTDGIDDVARNMAKAQVRRLPVVNHAKRLVGIVSLGDLARNDDPTTIGRTVSKVSTPGGKHDQTATH
jgi:CBS domain-containing protein